MGSKLQGSLMRHYDNSTALVVSVQFHCFDCLCTISLNWHFLMDIFELPIIMPGSNLSLEISKIFLLYSKTWICAFSVRSGLNLLKLDFLIIGNFISTLQVILINKKGYFIGYYSQTGPVIWLVNFVNLAQICIKCKNIWFSNLFIFETECCRP